MGGGVGNSPPPGSSPPPGGPPKGPGGSGGLRPLAPSPPPVTAMLTTAGVTFLTISENPWAIEGGTPAPMATGWFERTLSTQARTSNHINALLHFTMTRLLQKVIEEKRRF